MLGAAVLGRRYADLRRRAEPTAAACGRPAPRSSANLLLRYEVVSPRRWVELVLEQAPCAAQPLLERLGRRRWTSQP
jgi:hypothetical protein